MEEQTRTAIIYDAQKKMLAANYEMAEIRSLLNELMALEEMDEVIARANAYMAEAELRISRNNSSERVYEEEPAEDKVTDGTVSEKAAMDAGAVSEIVEEEQKRIIEKLLRKGIVPAQIHQWLDFPMEMIIEVARSESILRNRENGK